jgi:hypothetical protein
MKGELSLQLLFVKWPRGWMLQLDIKKCGMNSFSSDRHWRKYYGKDLKYLVKDASPFTSSTESEDHGV